MPSSSVTLGVNIDHVATLRQARYARTDPAAPNIEPDLLAAAAACERAGAVAITIHLRADRRHLQDRDLDALRAAVRTRLNLELGNTPEIVAIALRAAPPDVCLVPENRQEVTTEGGLDAAGQRASLAPTVSRRARGWAASAAAAERAHALGLHVNAGHGLNYVNLPGFLAAVPHLEELNIGHSIVSRAVFVGLENAVREMIALMR